MIFAKQTQTFQIELDAVFRVDIQENPTTTMSIFWSLVTRLIKTSNGIVTSRITPFQSKYFLYPNNPIAKDFADATHVELFGLFLPYSLPPPPPKCNFFSLLRTFRSQINTTPSTLLWLLAIPALWRDAGGKIAKVDSH